MRRWDGLLDRYARLLETRGLATATIDHRVREATRFGTWLKKRRPRPSLEEIDADLIVGYVSSRTSFHARSTVSGVVSCLRSVGEFVVSEGIWRVNPLRWMRGPKIDHRQHLPRRIKREDMKALWGAAEGRRQEHARYQSLCALGILYGTGLRRGELERLEVSDWDGEAGTLKIDGRKTGRERQVPVGEGVRRCIEAYLPRRHNRLELTGHLEEPALLVNGFGKRLTGPMVGALLGRLAKSSGVARVTAHQFRHSCASDLLEAGVTIPEVQKILGHAAIESTTRYTAIADPARALAMSKHPVNGFLGQDEAERKAS